VYLCNNAKYECLSQEQDELSVPRWLSSGMVLGRMLVALRETEEEKYEKKKINK
jgi:hypothetical protein